MGDPVYKGVQSLGIHAVVNEATLAPTVDEAGLPEGGQVLRDGGLGDAEACRQFGDGSLARGERFEDRSATGVRESEKETVLW